MCVCVYCTCVCPYVHIQLLHCTIHSCAAHLPFARRTALMQRQKVNKTRAATTTNKTSSGAGSASGRAVAAFAAGAVKAFALQQAASSVE